ncbi:hypothetical protein [Psychroflexus maritimus]|uniref:Uncharacterized protein n=1 Tax=Psychroflexus maritimus TaxID=2714865 RepID=A0A967AD13_9FLAO|nr:hypothetical protein [Psychroflexus maritimus]NGZ90012.1 hypothetical protein [Psychroflexus maritimus]
MNKIKTKLNFLLFSISTLCFIACGSVYLDGDGFLRPNINKRKAFDNSYGTLFPKEPDFSLKGKLKEYEGEFLIDTTAVYIINYGEGYAGPYHFDNKYSFLRFFSSGHVFLAGKYDEEFVGKDFSTFNRATVGYYTFEDGKILVEFFVPSGRYRFNVYEIIDSLTILKAKTKPRSRAASWDNLKRKEHYFHKRNVDSLWGEPYW